MPKPKPEELAYRSPDDLLRTALLTVRVNEQQFKYAEQLLRTGLWGNTYEACFEELIRRAMWDQHDRGRIILGRADLRVVKRP